MICPDFVVSEIHKRALGADGQPLGENPMADSKIMTAEECAALMVTAIEQRQRLLITSARGKQARWLKLLSPGSVDKLAAAAISKKQ
jgi:short-subunit dehydrogenase